MAFSNVYRIILLGVLPLVALLIYFKGQNYDPHLIHFTASESGMESLSGLFPEKVDAFSLSGQVRSYTKENLYEYVDGHAEYFISAGFVKLAVGEYSLTSKDDPDVVIDIYDMGKSIHAFGILSDEAGGNITDIHSGLTGFITPRGLGFIKGQYYIKISSFSTSASPESFIESLNTRISADSDPFPEFASLPDIGETVTTRFIKEAYRGLDFINNVLEREYNVDGKSMQVFVLSKDNGTIKDDVNLFIKYFNHSDITFTTLQENGKTVYKINDPYEGNWVLIASDDRLLGIFGAYNEEIINILLK